MFGLIMKAWVTDRVLYVEAWEPILRKREGSLEMSFEERRFKLRAHDGFNELIDTAQFLVGWLKTEPIVAASIIDLGEDHAADNNARALPVRRDSDVPVPP
jgi:hypothetical protein